MPAAFPPPVFDSLVMAAVAEEITQTLVGSRITDAAQPDGHTIGLRLRTGPRAAGLLCSIHPRWARCLVTPPPAGRPLHPFALQLRARLAGGRLRAVAAESFERILVITCDTLEGEVDLVLEVMGRHSNLLLIDAGRIAGAFKTVTPAMSRVRPILPGRPYARPPQDRPTPADVDPQTFSGWLKEGRAVSEVLVRNLRGISPPVAAHLARQAGLDPEAPAPEAGETLLAAVRGLAETAAARRFAPVWYADDAGHPVAYAALPLLVYGTLTPHRVPHMSAAVSVVLDQVSAAGALGEQRQSLLARIVSALRRAERAAAEVQAQLTEAKKAAQWRRFGELLLAYAGTVAPAADQVTVPDFDGTPLTIPLDPRRSAVGNAQAYFRRHAKTTAAGRALPVRLAALQEEQAYLKQLRALADQAAGMEELRVLAQELGEAEPARGRRRRTAAPPSPAPRTFRTSHGLQILVGRSGRENDHVTFKLAGPGDLWLHARQMPGAHVILKTNGRTPAEEDINVAAAVAAYFSTGREATRVPVDVTLRRHVRKPRGAKPGMVTYREERTLMVSPGLPEEPRRPRKSSGR